jgi:hypothetical protein
LAVEAAVAVPFLLELVVAEVVVVFGLAMLLPQLFMQLVLVALVEILVEDLVVLAG